MSMYKHWHLLEIMPSGWRIDKTAGSPLSGYEFVTNGKSLLNGQERALLRIIPPQRELFLEVVNVSAPKTEQPKTENKTNCQVVDKQYARTVNELARQKFKQRLLGDILTDLTICEIEGWCKREYISELKELINSIGQLKGCQR